MSVAQSLFMLPVAVDLLMKVADECNFFCTYLYGRPRLRIIGAVSSFRMHELFGSVL